MDARYCTEQEHFSRDDTRKIAEITNDSFLVCRIWLFTYSFIHYYISFTLFLAVKHSLDVGTD